MARPSVTDRLRAAVSEGIEKALQEFSTSGQVVVPLNRSGAINVSKLVDAWGLEKSDRQHLYKPEIVTLINGACATLGIGGILTGNVQDDLEDSIRSQIARTRSQAKSDAQAAVEAKAEVQSLVQRIRQLELEQSDLKLYVQSLEARLELAREGRFVDFS